MSDRSKRALAVLGTEFDAISTRVWAWLLLRQQALYGLSAARILVGLACLGILLSNFRVRHVIWGAGSEWVEPYRAESDFGWLLNIYSTGNPLWFTLEYFVLIVVTCAVIIGYRTRFSVFILAFGIGILFDRAGPISNQGDNIIRIGLLLMILMNVSEYWSLDSRRRRLGKARADGPFTRFIQKVWRGEQILPTWLVTILHNVALLALAFQLFILYTASALFKAQGSNWQEGTALYFPISLPEYSVMPGLNSLLTSNDILVTLGTYFAFFAQLFFVMGLLHPMTRRVVLVAVIMMHIGIAVLMGLPWFSIGMVAFDTIFVSSRTYQNIERLIREYIRRFGAKILRVEYDSLPAP